MTKPALSKPYFYNNFVMPQVLCDSHNCYSTFLQQCDMTLVHPLLGSTLVRHKAKNAMLVQLKVKNRR